MALIKRFIKKLVEIESDRLRLEYNNIKCNNFLTINYTTDGYIFFG